MTTAGVVNGYGTTELAERRPRRPRQRVLLAEADAATREVMARALDGLGFDVTARSTMASAREALGRSPFHVALIDLGLPDGDAVELVSVASGRVPIIVLGALDHPEADWARSFDAGADDYLRKPIAVGELAARVRSLSRSPVRTFSRTRPERIVHGCLEIDILGRRIFVAGQAVALSKLEFDLLVALASRPGQACSREELTEWVWQAPLDTFCSNNLTEHVRRVRKKLGPVEPAVATVPKFGYRFDPEACRSGG